MDSNGFAFVNHILIVLLQFYPSPCISYHCISSSFNFMLILLISIGLVNVGQIFLLQVCTINIIFVNFVKKLQGYYVYRSILTYYLSNLSLSWQILITLNLSLHSRDVM